MMQSLRTFLKEAEDFAKEYTFSHLGLNQSLQKNVSMAYYEAAYNVHPHAIVEKDESGPGEIHPQRGVSLSERKEEQPITCSSFLLVAER
jgi:hypothetical protein